MALRTFLDSTGEEWQVYDVTPPLDERRHYDRRATAEESEPDRRASEDRRLSVGRVSRLVSLAEGWLCFERGDDRRRLTPIPKDWLKATDEELEQYRESARRVPATPRNGQAQSRRG